MNHTIEEIMESMIPDLQDMEERSILSSVEIKTVLKQRRQFEYKLRGLGCFVETYCNVITYETNLEKLRRKRKKKLGIVKQCYSDRSIIGRIHKLFQRALRKFASDMSLWWYYFDFAAAAKSGGALSAAFTKCLNYHPTAVEVWLRAANFEFFQNGNVKGARVLMMRGLELNPNCRLLWLGYLKLEIKIVQKERMRRRFLNLQNIRNLNLTEEEKEKEKFIDEALAVQLLLKKLFEQFPDDSEFVSLVLNILPPYDHYPELHETAFKIIKNLKTPTVLVFVCDWMYKHNYRNNKNVFDSWKSVVFHAQSILEFAEDNARSAELFETLVKYAWEKAQEVLDPQAMKLLVVVTGKWIELSKTKKCFTLKLLTLKAQIEYILNDDISEALGIFKAEQTQFERQENYWLQVAELTERHSGTAQAVLWRGVSRCKERGKLLIALTEESKNLNPNEAHELFQKVCWKDIRNKVVQRRYLAWCSETDRKNLETVVNFLIKNMTVDCDLYCHAAELLRKAEAPVESIEKVLQKNCSVNGEMKAPWLRLIQFYQDNDLAFRIPAVFKQASAVCKEKLGLFMIEN